MIPETNVRVLASVLDEVGEPLAGATTTLLAAGPDYLIVAQDLSTLHRYAPAFQEGSLLGARPGSRGTAVSPDERPHA